MLLSELEWGTPDHPHYDKNQAYFIWDNHNGTIYHRLDGLFDIHYWENSEPHLSEWEDLSAIEAQAVLFELTKQVTENADEDVQDHASR